MSIQFLSKGGIKTEDATATADDILSPKTAYVQGEKITGNMEMQTKINKEDLLIKTSYNLSLASNYSVSTPDGCILSTNTNGNIILTNLKTNEIKSYTQSELGITDGTTTNGGVKSISICKVPNKYGAYMVVFMTRSDWSARVTLYTSCCYYKDGNLGYINNVSQSKYYKGITRNSDWGRGSIICSNTIPNTFIFISAAGYYGRDGRDTGLSRIYTINDNLNSYTSVDLNQRDGEYSYQHALLKLSSNDRFLMFCHNSNTNALSLLNDNLSTKDFTSISDLSRPEFFEYNGSIYMISDKNFYGLDYNSTSGTYTKTKLNEQTVLPDTYREIAHNQNLIITLDNDNRYRIYKYKIDDITGINLTLLEEIDTNISFSETTVYLSATDNNVIYTGDNNNIVSISLIEAGIEIPEKINRNLHCLYNTIDSILLDRDVLLDKRFYNNNGLQIGAMPNNGELNYTPSNEAQTIPEGYTSGGTISGDANLLAENIKSGVTIFGITGTYTGEAQTSSEEVQ